MKHTAALSENARKFASKCRKGLFGAQHSGKKTVKPLKIKSFSSKKHFTKKCPEWYNVSIAFPGKKVETGAIFGVSEAKLNKLQQKPQPPDQRCGFGAKRSFVDFHKILRDDERPRLIMY